MIKPFTLLEQEKVPIDKQYIRIRSTHQPIEDFDGEKRVIVDEGEKFEVIFSPTTYKEYIYISSNFHNLFFISSFASTTAIRLLMVVWVGD